MINICVSFRQEAAVLSFTTNNQLYEIVQGST